MYEETKDYVELEEKGLTTGQPEADEDNDCREMLAKARELSHLEAQVNKQRRKVRGIVTDLNDLESPDVRAEFKKLDDMCAQWTKLEYEHLCLRNRIIDRIQKRGA